MQVSVPSGRGGGSRGLGVFVGDRGRVRDVLVQDALWGVQDGPVLDVQWG